MELWIKVIVVVGTVVLAVNRAGDEHVMCAIVILAAIFFELCSINDKLENWKKE